MFLCVFFFFFYSDFLYKAYVVGTHLNCINKSMQFKWVPTTYTFNLKSGCNLKTTELLDCALIGACALIRLNTVRKNINNFWLKKKKSTLSGAM